MKTFFLFGLIFQASLVAVAQYVPRSQGDIDLIKNANLAVVLKEPDEYILKKLKDKPTNLEYYKNAISDYNQYIKEAVTKEWHFSKGIVFISEQESEKLKQALDKDFCILEPGTLSNYSMGQPVMTAQTIQQSAQNPLAYHHYNILRANALKVVSAAHPKSYLLATATPPLRMTQGTVLYCIQQLVNQINDFEQNNIRSYGDRKKSINARAVDLKSKTLILCGNVIDATLAKRMKNGKLTEKDYPYENKYVEFDELSDIITSKDEHYAYVMTAADQFQTRGSQMYVYMVVDAKDGRLLYFTEKGTLSGYFTLWHIKKVVDLIDNNAKDSE